MSIDSYFAITSYGLVGAAFVALAMTGEVDLASVVVYAAALAASMYIDARGYKRLRPQEWLWRTLTIGYIPFIFLDAAFISNGNRVLALAHMTLFVSAVKLFQDKRERDWIFLYLIGFFQLLLAASLTFNASFIASLTAYIFFFVATLAVFEIKRARREVPGSIEEVAIKVRKSWLSARSSRSADATRISGDGAPSGKRGGIKYLVTAATVELVLVVVLTLPLFFFIPRLNSGSVGGTLGEAQTLTGFSDNVRLGDVVSIKTSSRVVMRVKLDRAPTKWLRWRGIALDRYDGKAWSITRDGHEERVLTSGIKASGLQGAADSTLDYPVPPDAGFPENLSPEHDRLGSVLDRRVLMLRQEFFLEPLNIGTLFAARKLAHIKGPFRRLIVQHETGAVSIDRRYGRLAYTAFSDIRTPSEADLRADPVHPATPNKRFLQLPNEDEGHIRLDPRIQKLAHEITRGLPDAYDRALAIEAYLKNNYAYSLNLKYASDDPLAEFLFNGKEGHCEYFATAMAIMLRTLHIPARVVNGFQMGEYNELTEMYVVRDRDAHSWVEAYFPGSDAWVEFDPTPSAGINSYSQGGLAARLMKYVDAAEVFWMDYIVTLDRGEQASIMIGLQHKLLSFKDGILYYYDAARAWVTGVVASVFVNRRWSASDVTIAIVALLLLGGVMLAMTIAMSHFKSRKGLAGGYDGWWLRLSVFPIWRHAFWLRQDRRRSAILFYQQMLSILSRRGAKKRPDQTPVEFADSQDSSLVREITDVYNRVRFGGETLDENEARNVGRLLAELKRSTKKKRRGSGSAARVG
jgi:transglutaminase-like putative cysteine protease